MSAGMEGTHVFPHIVEIKEECLVTNKVDHVYRKRGAEN